MREPMWRKLYSTRTAPRRWWQKVQDKFTALTLLLVRSYTLVQCGPNDFSSTSIPFFWQREKWWEKKNIPCKDLKKLQPESSVDNGEDFENKVLKRHLVVQGSDGISVVSNHWENPGTSTSKDYIRKQPWQGTFSKALKTRPFFHFLFHWSAKHNWRYLGYIIFSSTAVQSKIQGSNIQTTVIIWQPVGMAHNQSLGMLKS